MKAADDDFMAALTERVLFDRGWDVGTRVLTKDEFMASRAVTRRLPYVPKLHHETQTSYLLGALGFNP